LATVAWGFWGFFSAQAAHRGTALGVTAAALVIETLVFVPAFPQIAQSASWWLLGVGLSGAVAYAALFYAFRAGGPAGTTVAVTALYPVVTAIAAWVLAGQTLTWRQWLGVGLAVVAVALIATGGADERGRSEGPVLGSGWHDRQGRAAGLPLR
jgi:transporter family protein